MKDTSRIAASEVQGLLELARRGVPPVDLGETANTQLDRLIRARQRALVRGPRVPYAWGIGVLAAAAALFVILRAVPKHTEALSYVTQLTAPNGAPEATDYVFSDGSTVSIAPGGSMQVVSAGARASQLRLTRGLAAVRVIHRAETRWLFAAGPFDVEVVGTAFDLQWDPALRAFSLNLREGAVVVHGPLLEQPLLLHAGQKVMVSVDPAQVSVVPATPSAVQLVASSTPAVPAPEPSSSAAPDKTRIEPASPPPTPPASAPAPAVGWRSMVNHGQFAQVVAQAMARPVASCLSQCSGEDLRALGDAARYSNQPGLAARALLALRQRFPGTADSLVAAFLLGRTYDATHQWLEAGRWYDRYLTEAPHGKFAVEAAAGKSRANQMH